MQIILQRKRKLDISNGFPSKKIQPESPTSPCSSQSVYFSPSSGRSRPLIPTKDNPPPEMAEWLTRFSTWGNAERIMAINELIMRCEPTQARHMMQVSLSVILKNKITKTKV